MSLPELFIIESLTFDDEQEGRFEGQVISEILRRSQKECQYYYFRTKRELKKILNLFSESKYRYLHLSCHGNDNCVSTTLDEIPFHEFGSLIKPHLKHRRLFVSACSVANSLLADSVMPGSGCYSILGPHEDVEFSDAVILWAAFYHVMFRADSEKMEYSVIKAKAQQLANMHRVPLTLIGHKSTQGKPYSLHAVTPKGIQAAPARRHRFGVRQSTERSGEAD